MVSQIDKRKHKAVLSLGGNIGNVQATFNEAKSLLKTRLGNIVLTSSLYKTKAWGVVDQPDFLNQVVVIETVLLPTEVLNHCLAIEAELGRVRKEKWHERLIDIDVLFYDAAIIHTQELVVPHPYLQDRNFILYPLDEIIPHFIHPILKKTMHELKKSCKDPSRVVHLTKN